MSCFFSKPNNLLIVVHIILFNYCRFAESIEYKGCVKSFSVVYLTINVKYWFFIAYRLKYVTFAPDKRWNIQWK